VGSNPAAPTNFIINEKYPHRGMPDAGRSSLDPDYWAVVTVKFETPLPYCPWTPLNTLAPLRATPSI
jgi:hypothetical protein